MLISLLNDINTLKSTDNATPIELAIMNDEQEYVNLSDYKNINISIGKNGVIYSSITPEVLDDNKTMSFTLDGNLPFGKYILEVNLIKDDDTVHVAPNRGDFPFTIEKSLNELGETVTLMSVQELISSMEDVKTISKDSNNKVTQAIQTVNNAENIANSALDTANNASTIATNADTNATDALNNSNQAISTSNTANEKSDNALSVSQTATTTANDALNKANQAISDSSNAVNTANDAKNVANQVRSEFDQIVQGNSDAEVTNARTNANGTTFTNLKARLDDSDSKLNQTNTNLSNLQQSFSNADKTTVGLGNVDNTSDLDKPISTATQSALDDIENEIGILSDLNTEEKSSTVGAINEVNNKIDEHQADYMPHQSGLNSYATSQDTNGYYTVVTFKRSDATKYLVSTLSNPDANGYYQTCTWNFYDNTGTTIALTKTWTFTYDSNGKIITKEVA